MAFSALIDGAPEIWLDTWASKPDLVSITQGNQQVWVTRDQLRELAEVALAELDYDESGSRDRDIQDALKRQWWQNYTVPGDKIRRGEPPVITKAPSQFDRAIEECRALDAADAAWAAERGLQCGCVTCQIDWNEAHPDD